MYSGHPEDGFGALLAASWDPFCSLCWWVCAASEKELPRTVFRCESQKALIAKTGKPYSTSYENRGWAHDGVHLPTCTQNASIFLSKLMCSGIQTDTLTNVLWYSV